MIEWWKQIQQYKSFNSEEVCNTTQWVVSDWWIQIRNYQKILVKEDIFAIREIILKPLHKPDDNDGDYYCDYY